MSPNHVQAIPLDGLRNGTESSSNGPPLYINNQDSQHSTASNPQPLKQSLQLSNESSQQETQVKDDNGYSSHECAPRVPDTEQVGPVAANEDVPQSSQTPTRNVLAVYPKSPPPSTHSPRNISPESHVKQDFDNIRSTQEIIPSNANATRRLPTRADFPSSVSLEILQPVTDVQIEKVIIMLHNYAGTERSLEVLSRRLQQHYPESAFLLVRGQEGVPAGNSGYHWADPRNDWDGTFVNACRFLLLDVVKDSLIAKCGFSARDIILFGHIQGGMAALAATASWDTIEYGGAISLGGPMPDCAQLTQGRKAKTPVLALGSTQGDINPAALERMQKSFCHVTQDLRLRSQDAAPEAPEDLKSLMIPLLDFLAHRLRRDEWTKQAVLSLGNQPRILVRRQ